MTAHLQRAALQPRLVHLIGGLRLHQVEEAVRLLLDYIDARAAEPPVTRSDQVLAVIRGHLADYHLALDQRRHGVTACNDLVSLVEVALGSPWVPGHELRRRDGQPL